MPASTIWLFLFSAAFAVQMAYWMALCYGFEHARNALAPEPEAPIPPMSVVVAARNEADRLPALLAALTQQTHPEAEVILVDDASTDATPDLVRSWQRDHPHLHSPRIDQPTPPRKKNALTHGIAAAAHDLIAFTDADCTPPPDWLAVLARHHAAAAGATLFLGYSPFYKAPGLLNRLARYETFVTGFLTAASVGLGRPYMGVGRNLSYPRAVFERLGGFSHSLQSMSGDDDLLVQEVARRRLAIVCHVFDPCTFVPSAPPATWRVWFRQKLRHLSAGRFYDRGVQVHLTLFHATSIALWAAPLGLGWIGAGLLAAKLIGQGLVLRRAAHAFHERDLLPMQPFLEVLYVAYNLVIAPLGLVRTPKRW